MHDEIAERQDVVPRQLLVFTLKTERNVLYTFPHDFEVADHGIFHQLVLRELIIGTEICGIGMNLFHGRKHGLQKKVISRRGYVHAK